MFVSNLSADFHLIGGFLIAFIIALIRTSVLKKPPEMNRKFGDALLCGFGSVLSCIAAVHYGKIDPPMIMPVCGVFGFLGMLQVRSWILDFIRSFAKNRMNVELSNDVYQHQNSMDTTKNEQGK